LSITFEYQSIARYIEFKPVIRNKVRELINSENKKLGSITVIFTTNVQILDINRKFLNHSYYTDVITFSDTHKNTISGEIYISLEQVALNCRKFGSKFSDEVLRVIIHGILHLIGYKDGTEIEKSLMRDKEDHYLCKFNDADIIRSEKEL
jgi:probable rRNA maturation factor